MEMVKTIKEMKLYALPLSEHLGTLYECYWKHFYIYDKTWSSLGRIANLFGSEQSHRDTHGSPSIRLSTIHGEKGNQYDTVFVIGLADNIFPSILAADKEEERRLFYVACTRPKQCLFLSTFCEDLNGRFYERSPFLVDCDSPTLVSWVIPDFQKIKRKNEDERNAKFRALMNITKEDYEQLF
jgi:hypothetical protein